MEETLETIGLSHGEAVIYLALLREGSSKVYTLAQETGRHRTNIYDTLEKLEEKGLASHVVRDAVKYYSAAPPEKLRDFLEAKEEKLDTVMPELQAYHDAPSGDAHVEVYKGKEGLKTVLKDILRTGVDYHVFEEEGYIHDVLPYFYPTFNERLEEEGVGVKILAYDDSPIPSRELMEVRTLDFFAVPAATAIYADKVAIFVWDEPYHAIQIESASVAESYRNFFTALWSVAGSEE